MFTLVMLAMNVGFPQALRHVALISGLPVNGDRTGVAAHYQARRIREQTAVELQGRVRDLRVQALDLIHRYEGVKRRAELRLDTIYRSGNSPEALGEIEDLWAAMAACTDHIRRAVAAYALLSFAVIPARVHFLNSNPTVRAQLISDVVNQAVVHRGDGGAQEIAL